MGGAGQDLPPAAAAGRHGDLPPALYSVPHRRQVSRPRPFWTGLEPPFAQLAPHRPTWHQHTASALGFSPTVDQIKAYCLCLVLQLLFCVRLMPLSVVLEKKDSVLGWESLPFVVVSPSRWRCSGGKLCGAAVTLNYGNRPAFVRGLEDMIAQPVRPAAFPLPFRCLSLTFRCLSLAFHCLSLTFHCLSLTFHCHPAASRS